MIPTRLKKVTTDEISSASAYKKRFEKDQITDIKANTEEVLYSKKTRRPKSDCKCGRDTYSYLRHTNYIHIPLVMLSSPSSCHSLVPPTLPNRKPLQWKGHWFSAPKKKERNMGINILRILWRFLDNSKDWRDNSRLCYPFCMTSLAKEGVSSGLNATRRLPLSSKQYNYTTTKLQQLLS